MNRRHCPSDDAFEQLDALEQAATLQAAEEFAAKAISHARARLVLGRDATHAFFATLALKLRADPSWEIDTCATDGKRLVYNPAFIAGLTEELNKGLIAHEVMHCALRHHTRQGIRETKLWNVACDLAINPLLEEAGFALPNGGCFPGRGHYSDLTPGLSAEEYYELQKGQQQWRQGQGEDGQSVGGKLQPSKAKPNKQDAPGEGEFGKVQPPGDSSEADCKESEADWEVAVCQAKEASKRRGSLPGGLERLVADIKAPKVDWREVLREFISRHARNDYAWSPPNRRFLHQDLYLPGMRSEELGEVVCAVDTSGSVGPQQLNRFASEMQGILDSYPDCELVIMYHDSEVKHVHRWKPSDGPLQLAAVGGGGTSHVPVFEHIERDGWNPTCVVCLTDLYTEFPAASPPYPVLWAVVNNENAKAPFGAVVHVE